MTLLAAVEASGLRVDDLAAQRLRQYLAMLLRWNAVYNLSAVREAREALALHLSDSLSVVAPLQNALLAADPSEVHQQAQTGGSQMVCRAAAGVSVLDVGSGGGLPGVVLAIMAPQWHVDCIDAVAKKATFIRQVAAELGLQNLQGLHGRVESLVRPGSGAYDAVICRAFASLADFTALTQGLLKPGGLWMAMKGKTPEGELDAVRESVDVFHVEQIEVPGLEAAERCLVWMRPKAPEA